MERKKRKRCQVVSQGGVEHDPQQKEEISEPLKSQKRDTDRSHNQQLPPVLIMAKGKSTKKASKAARKRVSLDRDAKNDFKKNCKEPPNPAPMPAPTVAAAATPSVVAAADPAASTQAVQQEAPEATPSPYNPENGDLLLTREEKNEARANTVMNLKEPEVKQLAEKYLSPAIANAACPHVEGQTWGDRFWYIYKIMKEMHDDFPFRWWTDMLEGVGEDVFSGSKLTEFDNSVKTHMGAMLTWYVAVDRNIVPKDIQGCRALVDLMDKNEAQTGVEKVYGRIVIPTLKFIMIHCDPNEDMLRYATMAEKADTGNHKGKPIMERNLYNFTHKTVPDKYKKFGAFSPDFLKSIIQENDNGVQFVKPSYRHMCCGAHWMYFKYLLPFLNFRNIVTEIRKSDTQLVFLTEAEQNTLEEPTFPFCASKKLFSKKNK